MGALADARHDIVLLLKNAPGVPKVHEVMPTNFTPPCVIFAPGEPWLETKSAGGIAEASYKVRVIAGVGTNAAAANALVSLVEATWSALWGAGSQWVPMQVDPITYVLDDGRAYTAADITVSNTIRTISD